MFRAPWAIFWVALGLRLATIAVGHTYRVNPMQGHFYFGFEAGRIARSLVSGQGYANPFNGDSGPTAWLPPLYPLLMALAFKLFGVYTKGAAFFLMALNSVFSAAVAPAVYEIAARCFDARGLARRVSAKAAPVALWSAWLWVAYPAALQYAVHWIWEMSLSTMLFAWIVVLALRLRRVGEESQSEAVHGKQWGLWCTFGLLWGLLMLSNASLLLCLPAMLVWIGWPKSSEQITVSSEQLKGALVACLACGLVMLPWIVRNERVLHAFVPTRSNLGIELYQSTLDANDGMPWGTTLPLRPDDREFKRYVAMGEIAYSREMNAEAKARIAERPGQMARWSVDRFFYFWDGTPHAPDRHPVQEFLRQLSYSFLSVCGVLGLMLMGRRRVEGAGLMALVFVLMPLPYYLITVQPRFRAPMEPLIAVLAVYLFRSADTTRKFSGVLWRK